MKMAHRKIKKCQVQIEKKPFQDDYMFGLRQLKGLKLPQIILKYVNNLSAKFDFQKVKQNKVREDLFIYLSKMCQSGHFGGHFGKLRFKCSHATNHTFSLLCNSWCSIYPNTEFYNLKKLK